MSSVNVQLSQILRSGFFGAMQQPHVQVGSGQKNPQVPMERQDHADEGRQRDSALSRSQAVDASSPMEAGELPRKAKADSAVIDTSTSNHAKSASMGAVFHDVAFQESRSLSLEIETVDGDVVTLRLDRSSSGSKTLYGAVDAAGSRVAIQQTMESGTQLEFSIEGDLSKEERYAIKDLVHQLDKLADKFFLGDMEGVMKRLGSLGFNEQQLAGFSFDLGYQQSVQAVSAYYETVNGAVPDDLAKAAKFSGEIKQLPRPQFMKHPGRDIGKLFSEMVEHKAREGGYEKPSRDILQRLESLMGTTFELADTRKTA